ncbi:MAG: GAF domain-containing protein, partial [Candidatus Woesearchaeota archaeon]|nr:GAF domain-containing protein [Candidatus Woesearchaeota archaeon]
LIKIARCINSTLDIDTILKYLVDTVIKELGYDVCSILLKEGDILVNKTGYGLTQQELSKIRIKFGEGVTGMVAQMGKPEIINDVSKDERYVEFSNKLRCQSEMAVPIIVDQELIGVFNIEDRRKNAFGIKDLEIITAVANEAAVAIRNAKTKESLDIFNKRLLRLYETGKHITSSLNVKAILQRIVDTVADTLNCHMVSFMMLKHDHLYIGETYGFDAKYYTDLKIPLGKGITGTVAQTGIPEVVGDVTKDTRYIPYKRGKDSSAYTPIKSEICVPIVYKGRTMGAINAESEHLNHFTHEDLKFLSALGDQAGSAIENARYYERIKNFNKELKHKIDEATIKLKNTNVELERLNRIKSDFVSTVSHELRTPMTSIVGYISIMADEEVGKLTDQQKEFMHIVMDESQRLTRLISDLLDISKIESGKMKIDLESVDLTEFVNKFKVKAIDMAEESKIHLHINHPSEPIMIHGNADRIDQIFTNLLSNAVKFSESYKNVIVDIQHKGDSVQVDVKDEGQGIPKDQLDMIFERFHQVDSNMNRSVGGTGLGLAITRHLVEAHGGKISVSSEEGKGSTFSFTFLKNGIKPSVVAQESKTQENLLQKAV